MGWWGVQFLRLLAPYDQNKIPLCSSHEMSGSWRQPESTVSAPISHLPTVFLEPWLSHSATSMQAPLDMGTAVVCLRLGLLMLMHWWPKMGKPQLCGLRLTLSDSDPWKLVTVRATCDDTSSLIWRPTKLDHFRKHVGDSFLGPLAFSPALRDSQYFSLRQATLHSLWASNRNSWQTICLSYFSIAMIWHHD